jgi:hypothetical protein
MCHLFCVAYPKGKAIKKMEQKYTNQKNLTLKIVVFAVVAVMLLSQTAGRAAAEFSNAEKREMVEAVQRAAKQGAPYVERYLESVKDKLGVDTTQEAKDMISRWAQELAGAVTNSVPATAPTEKANTATEEEEEGLSTLQTVAIVGTVAAVAIAVGGVLFLRKRNRRVSSIIHL